jgi:hypothetical protein
LFAVENLRLKELAIVAEQNKEMFDDFVSFLAEEGFSSLHSFVTSDNPAKTVLVIQKYFARDLPDGIKLYDGVARPYAPDKAKWLMMGWILRDAPEQRLKPMVSSMPGNSVNERRARLLERVRAHVATIFPTEERWEWSAICEVFIDRLEGLVSSFKCDG